MDEFLHTYEMESLELGITARKDVVDQIKSFFPASGHSGLFRTAEALATRRQQAKDHDADDEEQRHVLRIAGNSRECFSNRLRNIQLVALSAALVKSKLRSVRSLDMRFNRLGEVHDLEARQDELFKDESRFLLDAAPSLGRLLQSPALCIEELDLSGNHLGSESCKLLCASLLDNATLKSLNLRGNPLGVSGGHAIAELLSSSGSGLQELDVGATQLEAENLIAIGTALRSNARLTSLNLDSPVVRTREEEAVQHLGKMLQVNDTLRSLSLAKHQLTDHGAQVLAERLLDNDTLQSLGLRANDIGATGASALAALLLRHPSLAQLDLSANRIGDHGARSFALVLQQNISPLATLSLCSTYLTDDGLAALAQACADADDSDSNRLQSLLLWGNDFGPVASGIFYELLCTEEGRLQRFGVETDFLPLEVDCLMRVAHQETHRSPKGFDSPKR